MLILNTAAYKFVSLSDLPALKVKLREVCEALALKGTILLSPEGINLMLSGLADNVQTFKSMLQEDARFANIAFKDSESDEIAFDKLFVKIKKEAIACGLSEIQPEHFTAPRLSPEELQQWLSEKREVVLLDARNAYEVALGTFENALHLDLKHFRHFSKESEKLDPALKSKPVVTFCTGGIRCEKASVILMRQGFQKVYQLDGGILNYFEKTDGAHYQGTCFVFDKRVAVNAHLKISE